MIKLSVMYPAGEGTTFDMDYYRSTHMDIVRRTMNPSKVEIDEGNPKQPYLAIGHLYFDSPDAMKAAMSGPGAAETQVDIPNFTNAQPRFQISNVVE